MKEKFTDYLEWSFDAHCGCSDLNKNTLSKMEKDVAKISGAAVDDISITPKQKAGSNGETLLTVSIKSGKITSELENKIQQELVNYTN